MTSTHGHRNTQQRARQRLGDLDAIDAGRHDAAGIPRAFAGRVQAAHVQALVILAAGDLQGRRRAGLDAGQHRIGHGEARDLPFEGGQGLADGDQAALASAQATLDASAEAFAKTDTNARNANQRTRSEEEVTLVFDRHKSQLQGIYNRARRSNPTLKGKLVLAVTIEPNGSVSGVKVVSSELKDQALIDSLLARIRNFQFGAREVEKVTVNYPIEFLPY